MQFTIVAIMESWPLQLELQSASGREFATLAAQGVIQHRGRLIAPGELRPGQHIRILQRTSRGEIAAMEIID